MVAAIPVPISYQFMIEVPSAVRVQVGRLREFEFPPGTYVYTGSARRSRASIFTMADQSRHRSLDVLREYVRDGDRFADHAGAGPLDQLVACCTRYTAPRPGHARYLLTWRSECAQPQRSFVTCISTGRRSRWSNPTTALSGFDADTSDTT
jgi:hypothetical protein